MSLENNSGRSLMTGGGRLADKDIAYPVSFPGKAEVPGY